MLLSSAKAKTIKHTNMNMRSPHSISSAVNAAGMHMTPSIQKNPPKITKIHPITFFVLHPSLLCFHHITPYQKRQGQTYPCLKFTPPHPAYSQ